VSEIRNEFKSKVDSYLKRISNILILNSSFINNLGLLNGKMGVALFFYHYSVYSGIDKFKDLTKDMVNCILQEISDETPIDFANGLTGIGWGIEYLVNRGFLSDVKEITLIDIDNRIYIDSLKTPLILVNKEDICSYGLYYLSRLHEDDSLKTLVKKQLLIYLHDDIERMITQRELFGFEVPRLTINQLNSLLYFLYRMQELQLFPVKLTKLERLLPGYIVQKVEKSDSIIENYTLKKLLEILCAFISDKDLKEEYKNLFNNLEEGVNYDFSKRDCMLKELNILAWYSLIYPIDYYDNTTFENLIDNMFTDMMSEMSWDNTISKLNDGKIGLSNGIAGCGIVLMEHINFHNA
jgi:hypothetical protein